MLSVVYWQRRFGVDLQLQLHFMCLFALLFWSCFSWLLTSVSRPSNGRSFVSKHLSRSGLKLDAALSQSNILTVSSFWSASLLSRARSTGANRLSPSSSSWHCAISWLWRRLSPKLKFVSIFRLAGVPLIRRDSNFIVAEESSLTKLVTSRCSLWGAERGKLSAGWSWWFRPSTLARRQVGSVWRKSRIFDSHVQGLNRLFDVFIVSLAPRFWHGQLQCKAGF